MEQKLNQLREQVQQLQNNIQQTVEAEFKKLTDKQITVRSDIRNGYRFGESSFEIAGTVSFINEEGKRDFGSDFDFRYNASAGLKINQGTMGEYGKDDIYQVERILVVAKIWSNIAQLEQVFGQFDATCYYEFNEVHRQIERQKEEAKKLQRQQEMEVIEKNLAVGDVVEMSVTKWTTEIHRIKSITAKNIITAEILYFGTDREWEVTKTTRTDKEKFISSIHSGRYSKIKE